MVLRKLGARTWVSMCVLCWGAAQLGMGFVPKWGYLVLCRALLGAFEVGFIRVNWGLDYILTDERRPVSYLP